MLPQSSQEDRVLGHTIERLDRVSRAMNPFLLFFAVSLVVLNLACVVNLIDWTNLPQAPAAETTAAAQPAAAAAPAVLAPRAARPAN